ncbi:glycerate kinase [Leucobacter allii]|uniref:glycerate kinase n=1 Tax=Leucobacter allii TaxID=2932247 RepID=UPI001FD3327F|nr:glycerate kinase [Leucobacter allii]UOR01705.1 glycerate kinase [Leucobacter allii]
MTAPAPAPRTIVVVAPDSFKGSCTSSQAARAMAGGLRAALGAETVVRELPLADGGEGTLDALVAAWGGGIHEVVTRDALGRPRTGRIGIGVRGAAASDPLRAIVEAADANGLPAVADLPPRPLDADSAGVGVLVRAALDAGTGELLLGIGGSATSDGGTGMLRELGVRFLDRRGDEIAPGARGLAALHEIDATGLDPRAAALRWRIACDVDQPLTGPRGAAAVFGPQKGADAAEVVAIDAGLGRLADAFAALAGVDAAELRARAGLGAAGGLALGPAALLGAELLPGSALVADAVGLRAALADADLVVTGEGRFDASSLDGKVVSRLLAETAGRAPVVVIAGALGITAAESRAAGVAAAFTIADGPASLARLQTDAESLIEDAAARVGGLFAAARSAGRAGRAPDDAAQPQVSNT